MMRVIVEIHPGGDERGKRKIAVLDIGNVSNLSDVSDYVVHASLDDMLPRTVVVKGHRRAAGWMPLVRSTLTALERDV